MIQSELDIKQVMREFVYERLLYRRNGNTLGDDTSMLDEGIVDSTGVLELVLYVEEEFGFEVDDEDITPDNFDTLNCLAAYIQGKLA